MLHLTRIVAGILLLLGLLLGVVAWRLARSPAPAADPPGAAAPAPAGRPVVVAARSLPAGQAVAAGDLRIERLAIAPDAALEDPAPLIGRTPVADLPEGMPLAPVLFSSGLAQRLAPGERAVAVRADDTIGVGHQVRPGDFVDVHLVLKRDGGEIDQSRSRRLLARSRVLAYGGASVDGPGPGAAAGGARPDLARTVVLAVPADRIDALTLAETQGRLFLALRSPQEADGAGDGAPPEAAGRTLRQLAGQGAATVAAVPAIPGAPAAVSVAAAPPPAAARRPSAAPDAAGSRIEIIRGSVQEVQAY